MARKNNIFHNIIKNETSVTELFCNLMIFKPFRVLFLNIVKEKGAEIDPEKIGYDCFETEIDLGKDEKKHGRADLVLTIDEGDEYIFEIKIESWCNLTENQPESYLKYLDSDNKRLFFIIPESYSHISEVYDRWNKCTGHLPDNIKENNIIYWEDVLERIKDAELDKLSLFIKEFVEIMDDSWFYYEDIVFTQEEIWLINLKESEEYYLMTSSSVPKLIQKIINVIDGVNQKKDYIKQDPSYYGYHIKNSDFELDDEIHLFFGIQYIIWEKRGNPILIEVSPTSNKNIKGFIKKIQTIIPEACSYVDDDFEEFCYIPFNLEKHAQEENTNISKKLEEEIRNVIEKLKML